MANARTELGDLLYDYLCKAQGVEGGAQAATGSKTEKPKKAKTAEVPAEPAAAAAMRATRTRPSLEIKPEPVPHPVGAPAAAHVSGTGVGGKEVNVPQAHVADPNSAANLGTKVPEPRVQPSTRQASSLKGTQKQVHKYAWRQMKAGGEFEYGHGPAPEGAEAGNFHVHNQGTEQQAVEARPWLRRVHSEPQANYNPHSRASKKPSTKHESSISSLGKTPKKGEEINLTALDPTHKGAPRILRIKDYDRGTGEVHIEGRSKPLQAHEWHSLMESHFGDHYVNAVDNRVRAHARAVYKYAPRQLLGDPEIAGKSDIHDLTNSLVNHTNAQYRALGAPLESALKRAGVTDSGTARGMINYLATRRGWHADARAALLGAAINGGALETARIAKNYKKLILAAEKHAGRGMVTSETIANLLSHEDFGKLATEDITKFQQGEEQRLADREAKKLKEINEQRQAEGKGPVKSREEYAQALAEMEKRRKAEAAAKPPAAPKTPEQREAEWQDKIQSSSEAAMRHRVEFENVDSQENPPPSEHPLRAAGQAQYPHGMGTARDEAGAPVPAETVRAQDAAQVAAAAAAAPQPSTGAKLTPAQEAAFQQAQQQPGQPAAQPEATTEGAKAVEEHLQGQAQYGQLFEESKTGVEQMLAQKHGEGTPQYRAELHNYMRTLAPLQYLQQHPRTKPEVAVQKTATPADTPEVLQARLAWLQQRVGQGAVQAQQPVTEPAAEPAQQQQFTDQDRLAITDEVAKLAREKGLAAATQRVQELEAAGAPAAYVERWMVTAKGASANAKPEVSKTRDLKPQPAAPQAEPASVPTMVTQDQHQQLAALGWDEAARNKMTPKQAQAVLAGGVRKLPPVEAEPPRTRSEFVPDLPPEPTKEPEPVPAAEPAPEPEPVPAAEVTPEPIKETEPAPAAPEPAVEPAPESAPAPSAEATPAASASSRWPAPAAAEVTPQSALSPKDKQQALLDVALNGYDATIAKLEASDVPRKQELIDLLKQAEQSKQEARKRAMQRAGTTPAALPGVPAEAVLPQHADADALRQVAERLSRHKLDDLPGIDQVGAGNARRRQYEAALPLALLQVAHKPDMTSAEAAEAAISLSGKNSATGGEERSNQAVKDALTVTIDQLRTAQGPASVGEPPAPEPVVKRKPGRPPKTKEASPEPVGEAVPKEVLPEVPAEAAVDKHAELQTKYGLSPDDREEADFLVDEEDAPETRRDFVHAMRVLRSYDSAQAGEDKKAYADVLQDALNKLGTEGVPFTENMLRYAAERYEQRKNKDIKSVRRGDLSLQGRLKSEGKSKAEMKKSMDLPVEAMA